MAEPVPIACTLTTKDAASQLDEWSGLRAAALAVEPLDGGVRVRLPRALEAQARDLAAREARCCAFLTLSVDVDDAAEEIAVTITGPAEAEPVIALLVRR